MHAFSPGFVTRFRQAIHALHPIDDSTLLSFLEQFEEVEAKKGTILLREGEVCRHLYFILKGSLRCYLHDEKGREVNQHFYFEDELASEFKSLRLQEPSDRHLVCMTPCKLLKAARPDYLPLFETNIDFNQAAFRFFQDLYLQEEEHAEMLRRLSAEDRYRYVVEHKPHLLQRVSLTQLASWLGTSRESLSRIRARINS